MMQPTLVGCITGGCFPTMLRRGRLRRLPPPRRGEHPHRQMESRADAGAGSHGSPQLPLLPRGRARREESDPPDPAHHRTHAGRHRIGAGRGRPGAGSPPHPPFGAQGGATTTRATTAQVTGKAAARLTRKASPRRQRSLAPSRSRARCAPSSGVNCAWMRGTSADDPSKMARVTPSARRSARTSRTSPLCRRTTLSRILYRLHRLGVEVYSAIAEFRNSGPAYRRSRWTHPARFGASWLRTSGRLLSGAAKRSWPLQAWRMSLPPISTTCSGAARLPPSTSWPSSPRPWRPSRGGSWSRPREPGHPRPDAEPDAVPADDGWFVPPSHPAMARCRADSWCAALADCPIVPSR